MQRRLDDLERRLCVLEGAPAATAGASPRPAPSTLDAPDTAWPALALDDPLALAGRTLVALGGAYLLRAATESGLLPPLAGVSVGLLYAAAWMAAAQRAARDGRAVLSAVDAATAALVLYPLVWEAVARFGALPAGAAAAVAAVGGLAGAVLASRGAPAAVAWLHVLSASGLLLALLPRTRDLAAVALGAAVLHALGAWRGVRWVSGATLAGALAATVFVAGRPEGLPAGYVALGREEAAALVLALATLALAASWSRAWSGTAAAFDMAQSAGALSLAVLATARLQPGLAPALAGLAFAAGAGSYLAAQRARARPGLLLAFAAALVAPLAFAAGRAEVRVAVCAALGAALTVHGGRGRALAPPFLLAALAQSGWAREAAARLSGVAAESGVFGASEVLAVAAALLGLVLAREVPAWLRSLHDAAALGASLLCVAALLPMEGVLARCGGTLVLSAAALAWLALGRAQAPLLSAVLFAGAGLRLALVDLPAGAGSAFVGLVTYGGALMLAQRLRRAPWRS